MIHKLIQWMDRNRKTIWFSCLINAVFIAFLLIILRPIFETNDDISVAMIANGSWGVRDAHVMCQNYILGYLYTLLYAIGNGSIAWYAIFQLLCIYAAFSVTTYLLFQRLDRGPAIFALGIIWVYLGYECVGIMQYSKTAGVMMAAGVALILYEIMKEKIFLPGLGFGILLSFIGTLYRFEVALACGALTSGIGLYFLLNLKDHGKLARKKLVSCILSAAVLLGLCLGAEVIDRYAYTSDPEWNYYKEYNDHRCNLMDYSFPHYKEHKEEYKEMGLSKNALALMSKGNCFYDPEVYTMDVLRKMDEMRPKNQLCRAIVIDFLKKYPAGYLSIPAFIMFLILAFFWLVFGKKTWKMWVVAGYEIVVMGAIDFYLFFCGRYLINRVEVGLWFSISMVVIWFYKDLKTYISGAVSAAIAAIVLLSCQNMWQSHWRLLSTQATLDDAYIKDSVETLLQDESEDVLYLAKIGSITYHGFEMFDSVPAGIFDNVVWLGGWEVGNPIWKRTMEKYGVANPYRDMINNDKVYLVENNMDITMKYIHEYYDKDAVAEPVNEVNYLKVYRVVSK